MKVMKSILFKSVVMIMLLSVLCGVAYPLFITGVSAVCFKNQANGSIIEKEGVKYGSELLGQQFTKDEYLWGRVMNADTSTFKDQEGNPLYYSGPFNLTPASKTYEALIAERVEQMKAANPDQKSEKVPVELVTGSGSGLDPHISLSAANYQVPRIAKARNMTEAQVQQVIKKYTTSKLWGIFGEEVVNVLEVNLALDGKL